MSHTQFIIAAACVFLGLTASESRAGPVNRRPRHNPAVEGQLRQAFQRMDVNKDGFLDKQELARGFPGANPAQTLANMDRNRDGRVSWAEFDQAGEAYAARLNAASRKPSYARTGRRPAYRVARSYGRMHSHARPAVRIYGGVVSQARQPSYTRRVAGHGHRPAKSHMRHARRR